MQNAVQGYLCVNNSIFDPRQFLGLSLAPDLIQAWHAPGKTRPKVADFLAVKTIKNVTKGPPIALKTPQDY